MIKIEINKVAFGKVIKQARENLGLTQQALAYDLGLSPNFVSDMERGIKLPGAQTMIMLSHLLKLSLDSMFAASLDTYITEPETIYYTDKQLKILNTVVKSLRDHF